MPPKGNAPPSWAVDGPLPTEDIKRGVSGEYLSKSRAPSTGPQAFGLCMARVVRVDYALFQVALQIINGENDIYQWAPIPVTQPMAGARHFMGGLPDPGDICIVGWLSTEPKTPVILGWLPISVASGHEWLPVQDFLPTEVDMNPKTRSHFEGIYGRYRHKMRQLRPGVLHMASSQGAEVNLDEGVLLSNRRGNEVRIRDQDQAIVSRSLQQFHAMGGARIYGGMVQRDSTFLPRRMFSDGVNWDAARQESRNGNPLLPFELGDSEEPTNKFTPNAAFVRSSSAVPFPQSGLEYADNVDPYSFLARGLFIGKDGYASDPTRAVSDAEYGGKPMFRVSIDSNPESLDPPSNGILGEEITESDTLTEYRIELDHTWDGRLPVTEQTDGFDADRIPSDAGQESPLAASGPYLQSVLGSVVGNDPFTQRGRQLYGLPLVPVIFSGEQPEPRFESGIGIPLGQHAASLFRIDPPEEDPSRVPPMFLSATKSGAVRGFLSGPQDENSLELAMNGGMRLQANGPMVFDTTSLVFNLRGGDSINNFALELGSSTGAVAIRGNAPTTQGSFSARAPGADLQENNLPSVLIESPSGSTHIKSGRFTKISGANGIQLVDTNEVTLLPKQKFVLFTDATEVSCNTSKKTVQGKEVVTYSGPKNFLPTNRPLRETKFVATPLTGHAGGETDKYMMLFGDRQEEIRIGNHSTTVLVGNMTYQTRLGTATVRAGVNEISVNTVSGIRATSVSNINMTATLSASVSALASITLRSIGQARLSGLVTTLGGSGPPGRIISSTDRDPLTNLPLAFFGMGSFGHRLGAPI